MEKVRVGIINNTFGIKGELKIESCSDFAKERFKKGMILYVEKDTELIPLEVNSSRFHKNHYLVSFKDYLDINLVEKFKGLEIYYPKDERPKLLDGYYTTDFLDLDVYGDDKYLGKIIDIDEYPYHKVLRIKNEEKEFLVPLQKPFLKKVDLDNKRLDINVIEGLL